VKALLSYENLIHGHLERPFPSFNFKMSAWTHLVRFVAVEDDQIHLGQLVDPMRDVGLDSTDGVPIYAFEIEGTIYNGKVTSHTLQVRRVCRAHCSRRLCID
jgi:hypothetical protein